MLLIYIYCQLLPPVCAESVGETLFRMLGFSMLRHSEIIGLNACVLQDVRVTVT